MPGTPHLDLSRTGRAGDPAPCAICGKPAICRSPKGTPVHKTCVEAWTANRRRREDYQAVA
ncbi:hypothetical protein [Krasilnikovia cinnamomea]|uniref:hypothetical protein n=1 Tax=Krasilnikovia cinnamomea TaxID=349313 RepID=UPI00102C530E|nr:hypothetical protein [Krasilnikovia cinnamomea]